MLATIRDIGPYSTRNASKGALLEETSRVMAALASGLSLDEVRQQALEGVLLQKNTLTNRRTVWQRINYRLFAHGAPWVISDLIEAYQRGPYSPEFISIVYLQYCLRDHLAFDFTTEVIWNRYLEDRLLISRHDILSFLDEASYEQPTIMDWSDTTRRKVATSTLTAFRDFGLLRGTQKKYITQPPLPSFTAQHLLRGLVSEGLKGTDIVNSKTWCLFLRSPGEVSNSLIELGRENHIRYERMGSRVVLETPVEWGSR